MHLNLLNCFFFHRYEVLFNNNKKEKREREKKSEIKNKRNESLKNKNINLLNLILNPDKE